MPASCACRQRRVVAVQTLLRAVFGDVLHRALVQVAHEREVAVPLGRRLLVDADPAHDSRLLACSPPRHRPLHHAPRLVPADPQDPRGAAHVALTQHVDGEALEQQREPRPRLRPRHLDLDHAVVTACHPRDARVQVGLELATVQMPPGPFLGVIVQRQRLGAVRARPRRVLRMFGPDIHALPLNVQVHAAHGPRRLQAQQVLIQRSVLHGRSLLGRPYYPFSLPTGNPEAPKKRREVWQFPVPAQRAVADSPRWTRARWEPARPTLQ